ncbi:MAG TPA: DUF6498-containing protein [Saprospiraceae bacterium]|nr:DUF6498-containing protein [Saprospiraceae bacterium]
MNLPANIFEKPVFQTPRPWWLPIYTLAVALIGLFFLHWPPAGVVYLFWWEAILIVGMALIRMFFALQGRPFGDLLLRKAGLLVFGLVMGGAFILLTVAFTLKGFSEGNYAVGLGGVAVQSRALVAGYVAGLLLHYFGNGRFKTADPVEELGLPFAQLLVLLALLMALTQHLIPRTGDAQEAQLVGAAVVGVKFVIDMFFAKTWRFFQEAGGGKGT